MGRLQWRTTQRSPKYFCWPSRVCQYFPFISCCCSLVGYGSNQKTTWTTEKKISFHPLFSSKDLSQEASKRTYNNYIKALLQHSEVESPQTITLEKPEVHVSWTWQFWDDVNPEKVGTTEGLTRRASKFRPLGLFLVVKGLKFHTHPWRIQGIQIWQMLKENWEPDSDRRIDGPVQLVTLEIFHLWRTASRSPFHLLGLHNVQPNLSSKQQGTHGRI